MITENLSTLRIHKLTQEQYDNAVSSGNVNENELYLTPYEEIDLSPYATIEQLNEKASVAHTHEEYASVYDVGYLQSDVSDLQTNVTNLQSDVADLQTDVTDLQTKVGTTSVNEQITTALSNFSSGKTLTEHLAEESMVLTSLQYGDTLPDPGTPGRIFFLKVSE